jgi:hypothetical protein
MKTYTTYTAQSSDMAALFDMLRYEGGQVIDWTNVGQGVRGTVWRLTIRVEASRYTPDRWLSFGITPVVVSKGV